MKPANQLLFLAERRAIKVRCSDNNLYRVNPVFNYVKANDVAEFEVSPFF
jgi:hypothetical protein